MNYWIRGSPKCPWICSKFLRVWWLGDALNLQVEWMAIHSPVLLKLKKKKLGENYYIRKIASTCPLHLLYLPIYLGQRKRDGLILRDWLMLFWRWAVQILQARLADWRPRRVTVWIQIQCAGRIPSFSGEIGLFILISLTDWTRPTHIIQETLLQVYWFKCWPHLKNIFTEISWMMFDQISEYYGLANLTHKMNHHSGF